MGCLTLTYRLDRGDLSQTHSLDRGDLTLSSRMDSGDLSVTVGMICTVGDYDNVLFHAGGGPLIVVDGYLLVRTT